MKMLKVRRNAKSDGKATQTLHATTLILYAIQRNSYVDNVWEHQFCLMTFSTLYL